MSSGARSWKFRIRHMLEAIERIHRYSAGMSRDALEANAMAVDAIVWNLAVLGEAARHVPEDVASSYGRIPWAQIRAIRNRIIHGYDQIDMQIVWNVVQHELAPLVPELERIARETVE